MDTALTKSNTDIIDVLRLIVEPKKKREYHHEEAGRQGPFFTGFVYPGYAIATGVAAVAAINISFRTKKNLDGNLSFFNNNFQYTQKKQIIFQSLSNTHTNSNKWQFPSDIRFLHFPAETYGLGSNSPNTTHDKIDYYHLRFYRLFLHEVIPNTFIGGGYNLDYHWNIKDEGVSQGQPTDFNKYGLTNKSISSGICIDFLLDTRDNQNKPTDGTLANFQFVTYPKIIGSSSSWNSLIIDLRRYIPICRKWYTEVAFWAYIWLTLNGKPPYLDLPSTGWDSYNNTGRGYAAGRYRGYNMIYFETEFRFNILRNGLLGGVVFGNIQTLSGYPNTFFSTIQPGGGAGLRIKFNKHTDSNSALDYGFGSHGSRGFATNINEVF